MYMQLLSECMKIDCETDCDARGAPPKSLPRAPNYSGLALVVLYSQVGTMGKQKSYLPPP